MRLGIVQASQNKIGSLADEVLLYCYCYNPATGKYGAVISNVMRLAGLATILVMGGAFVLLMRKEKHGKASEQDGHK